MKDSSPQAKISLKVFGNEIKILSLNDLPFLTGEMGYLDTLKYLYTLSNGKQNTFKQNLILLEVSHAVPTIVGIPLKVAVNVSAVLTVDFGAKVNLFQTPTQMEGSLKLRYMQCCTKYTLR